MRGSACSGASASDTRWRYASTESSNSIANATDTSASVGASDLSDAAAFIEAAVREGSWETADSLVAMLPQVAERSQQQPGPEVRYTEHPDEVEPHVVDVDTALLHPAGAEAADPARPGHPILVHPAPPCPWPRRRARAAIGSAAAVSSSAPSARGWRGLNAWPASPAPWVAPWP